MVGDLVVLHRTFECLLGKFKCVLEEDNIFDAAEHYISIHILESFCSSECSAWSNSVIKVRVKQVMNKNKVLTCCVDLHYFKVGYILILLVSVRSVNSKTKRYCTRYSEFELVISFHDLILIC